MNCRDAIAILDRMIFEEIPADAGLLQHLNTCPGCSRAYAGVLEAREALNLVRRSEPVLRDPDGLMADILAGITKDHVKTSAVPLFLVRMLAAASVAMFFLFGYEQYSLVQRITTLERQCSQIMPDPGYSDLQHLASTLNISKAGISFAEVERLLSPGKGRSPLAVPFFNKRPDQIKNRK